MYFNVWILLNKTVAEKTQCLRHTFKKPHPWGQKEVDHWTIAAFGRKNVHVTSAYLVAFCIMQEALLISIDPLHTVECTSEQCASTTSIILGVKSFVQVLQGILLRFENLEKKPTDFKFKKKSLFTNFCVWISPFKNSIFLLYSIRASSLGKLKNTKNIINN